ncbi:PREDICTED: leukocyte receptor cluster member 1 homolog [Branchiostoma belcheri]|uniref:Leukocyte receptor cluster member 1 homolog n=1 Tax=Branchiostoma belcheri TaxID=7741 RepID=A0A6P4ZUI5_BRABE|nr:PREDICTED: leukocyte receptor cluster member 1 homolog [Branchiostoma belcheri]
MNILPKKSWHVRNKDNIAKVRRDEAKAAEEEKERERRRALAEQEARTELLRSRARQRLGEGGKEETIQGPSSSNDTTSVTGTELVPAASLGHQGHINFFKDLEEGKKVGGVNKEHEEEKKKEQEQREKDIGLLTYLGQSAVEAQGNKPWYLNKTRRDDTLKKEDDEQDKSSSVSSSLDMKRKNFLDPVHDMNRYLSKKRSKHQKEHKKKHKEKDRDRHKGSESRSRQGPSVSVQQLRAERLKREAEERAKTERLLALRRGEAPKPTEAEVMETSKFRYNSQFNPDLVRKPRPRYQPY